MNDQIMRHKLQYIRQIADEKESRNKGNQLGLTIQELYFTDFVIHTMNYANDEGCNVYMFTKDPCIGIYASYLIT